MGKGSELTGSVLICLKESLNRLNGWCLNVASLKSSSNINHFHTLYCSAIPPPESFFCSFLANIPHSLLLLESCLVGSNLLITYIILM